MFKVLKIFENEEKMALDNLLLVLVCACISSY